MTASLHVYCWVWWWKNFENRSTFGEVIGKSMVSCFFLTSNLVLSTEGSWLPWGKVAKSLISPLTPVPHYGRQKSFAANDWIQQSTSTRRQYNSPICKICVEFRRIAHSLPVGSSLFSPLVEIRLPFSLWMRFGSTVGRLRRTDSLTRYVPRFLSTRLNTGLMHTTNLWYI